MPSIAQITMLMVTTDHLRHITPTMTQIMLPTKLEYMFQGKMLKLDRQMLNNMVAVAVHSNILSMFLIFGNTDMLFTAIHAGNFCHSSY